jgi:hypothetical protein
VIFDVPVLIRPFSRNAGLVPIPSDREFWSSVLMSKRHETTTPYNVVYNLVTDTGDNLIDSSSNQMVAFTNFYNLVTSSNDRLVDNSSNGIIAAKLR